MFLELFEVLERGVLFSRLFGGDLLLDLGVQRHLILHGCWRQVAGCVLLSAQRDLALGYVALVISVVWGTSRDFFHADASRLGGAGSVVRGQDRFGDVFTLEHTLDGLLT